MWILKENFDQQGKLISVDVELELGETEPGVTEYLKKFYPVSKFNFSYPSQIKGYQYHKVDDVHPHVNVVEVNKIRRF